LAGFARLKGTEAGASWLDAGLLRPQQSRQYITLPPRWASAPKICNNAGQPKANEANPRGDKLV